MDDGISSHAKKTSTPQAQQFPLSASARGSRQSGNYIFFPSLAVHFSFLILFIYFGLLDDGTSSHAKKTRGITVGAGTCDVVKKSKKLIPIRLDPSQNLVASVEAQYLFVSEIGLITRNKAPLNVLGWKKVTLETKRDMAIALQVSYLILLCTFGLEHNLSILVFFTFCFMTKK